MGMVLGQGKGLRIIGGVFEGLRGTPLEGINTLGTAWRAFVMLK